MSHPQGEPQQADTPLTVVPPSPSMMPGAQPVMNAPVETMPKPPDSIPTPVTKPPEGEPTEMVELERFKAVQKIARELEKTSKSNQADAEAFRAMSNLFRQPDGSAAPDPLAEVQRLRDEIEVERTERVRERIARETGVPPGVVHGNNEEAMKESAAQALSWAQELAQKASGTPLAAPSETVTGSTPTTQTGVQQIQSRDELKGMSSKDIVAAYKEGRMDKLLGKAQ